VRAVFLQFHPIFDDKLGIHNFYLIKSLAKFSVLGVFATSAASNCQTLNKNRKNLEILICHLESMKW
jgi:hypothetical protein